jgi:pyruvate formate lyase activating enzyme
LSILGGERIKARFWDAVEGKVACHLCPHECHIADGKTGICGVRKDISGELIALTYGRASSMNVDPIEKKPLFHFHPGKEVLSFGSVGCNLGCLHCQNFTISQAKIEDVHLHDLKPDEVPEMCRKSNCEGVAWTYNEPIMWHEFVYDASKECKEKGLFTAFVTNGFINEEPLKKLAECIDAANIDVKGFRDEFYRKICKARLQPVLDTVELANDLGIHVELTYLIITGRNDSREEISDFCRWVSRIDVRIPVHFSRFHPDYLMSDIPSTPIKTMDMARSEAIDAGLDFVYLGNIATTDGENTRCPKCGSLAVRRLGFYTEIMAMTKNGDCSKCGEPLNMII